ncbi:MAG: RNA-binding transcriptional accessory protein [Rhodobacteraceae bacterium]|nr:RNA-binding transcriptional accessory protein [Paracoccaceae bacterium]
MSSQIFRLIASEINATPTQVAAAVGLLDEGSTVPFIARYRKEVTGGLDDAQLRDLAERLTYLREFEARRETIIKSISEQGKMTDDLGQKLAQATTKSELEDIYLPYKPKRRTKAMIARENGLEPLARLLVDDRSQDPEAAAAAFITAEVPDAKSALNGARDILTEELSENADLLARLRTHMRNNAQLVSKVIDGQQAAGQKFELYFDHSEPISKVAGHRALAMFRGRNEGFLSLDLVVDPDAARGTSRAEEMTLVALAVRVGTTAADQWLRSVATWAWRVKLSNSITIDLLLELREKAEEEAITVFGRNLKDLLLAAPAGNRVTLGLDPGIRTGVKVAAVDSTGKVLDTATIYPFQPKMDVAGSLATLGALIVRHKIDLIAIGNGTASRETEKLVIDLLGQMPSDMKKPIKVIVSEAGASVYSASALASQELPELDVSLRGAVSIARRLQDPLAELVKIEPKSIGVGQYQHDVDQSKLGRRLDAVVEDAVNAVGVNLNTASAPLLARVAGIGAGLAETIVSHREINGAFASRKDLLKVSRLGPKVFEQCAGFLRIPNGVDPLDASAVHPEAYDKARKILADCGMDLRAVQANSKVLHSLNAANYVDDRFGLPTIKDIFAELDKPGLDPRPEFKTASFAEGVNEIKDLKVGMSLEGTVTNVAAFGAFVDVGVHQDGLVHVSQLADRFIKDPHDVVKAGDIVRVRVVEVDVARKRIALSMRKDGGASSDARPAPDRKSAPRQNDRGPRGPKPSEQDNSSGSFGDLLQSAFKKT